jgi:glyoxylase I family protein
LCCFLFAAVPLCGAYALADDAAGVPAPSIPAAIETAPTLPNEIGMHRVAFAVDDIDEALAIAARHGCFPLRGVANYQDVYKLTYLRGPSGILVMFAQELQKP